MFRWRNLIDSLLLRNHQKRRKHHQEPRHRRRQPAATTSTTRRRFLFPSWSSRRSRDRSNPSPATPVSSTTTANNTRNIDSTASARTHPAEDMGQYGYHECLFEDPRQAAIFIHHGKSKGTVMHILLDRSNVQYSSRSDTHFSTIEPSVRSRRKIGTVVSAAVASTHPVLAVGGGDQRVKEVAARKALPVEGGAEAWLEQVRTELQSEGTLLT